MKMKSDINSAMTEFFKGKTIFITGGLGFVGKVLVEKILRSCEEIDRIYLLVRDRRGHDGVTRLKIMLDGPLFERVRNQSPNALRKVKAIRGDLGLENLGLTPEDSFLLENEVNIVIHSAATLRFDETLKKAVVVNALGTLQMLELAKRMRNLKSFVYVSSAFANAEKVCVEEKVYESTLDPKTLIEVVQTLPDDTLEVITPYIIRDRPHTYVFSKQAAESLVKAYCNELPVCIVRPSMITGIHKEPIPGWSESMVGAALFVLPLLQGICRTMLFHDKALDWIPVDHVVNLILAAAWNVTINRSPENLPVYHCTSGMKNGVTAKEIQQYAFKGFLEKPFGNVFWYPSKTAFTTCRFKNNMKEIFYEQIPAMCFAIMSKATGYTPKFLKIFRTFSALKSIGYYYHETPFEFSVVNTQKLFKSLSPADQEIFSFDIKTVEWEQYVKNYIHGLRKYTLKEADDTLLAANLNLNRLRAIHQGFRIFSIILGLALLYMVIC